VKHLDQQFHEKNKPIVHEGSDPIYDSYSSKLVSLWNDNYESDSLEGSEGDVEELPDQSTISCFPQNIEH
jgi:hypothetical protein